MEKKKARELHIASVRVGGISHHFSFLSADIDVIGVSRRPTSIAQLLQPLFLGYYVGLGLENIRNAFAKPVCQLLLFDDFSKDVPAFVPKSFPFRRKNADSPGELPEIHEKKTFIDFC